MLRKMTRKQFGIRLLCYHGGGGTATYALGSSIVADVPIHKSLIEACIHEMESDNLRLEMAGKDLWLARALYIWECILSNWFTTGTPPWEVPHG